jgi:hypothetical protein
MKRGFIKLLVMSMVCSLVFVLAGCATTEVTELPSLEGTWKHPSSPRGSTFVFTGNNWTLIQNDIEVQSGTFVQSKKSIKFTIVEMGKAKETWQQAYNIDGDTLNLTKVPNHNFGPYIKIE